MKYEYTVTIVSFERSPRNTREVHLFSEAIGEGRDEMVCCLVDQQDGTTAYVTYMYVDAILVEYHGFSHLFDQVTIFAGKDHCITRRVCAGRRHKNGLHVNA